MKRRKYGFIYKTHLFGRPTVRVMGAENVRHILLGEHRLVSVQWPASVRTILGSGCLSNLHNGQHKHRKKVRPKAGGERARRPRARRLSLSRSSPSPRAGDHARLLPGRPAALRARHPGGGERLPGALAGLRRALPARVPRGEAPHVSHRHENPAGLPAPPGQPRRRAAAGRGLRGDDPQPLLAAHRCAVQRALPGKAHGSPGEERCPSAGARGMAGEGWQCSPRPTVLPLPLGQGLRARNIIHAKIEENIRAKMARKEPEGGYKDALQLLMEHTQGNGEQLNMQVRLPTTGFISFSQTV